MGGERDEGWTRKYNYQFLTWIVLSGFISILDAVKFGPGSLAEADVVAAAMADDAKYTKTNNTILRSLVSSHIYVMSLVLSSRTRYLLSSSSSGACLFGARCRTHYPGVQVGIGLNGAYSTPIPHYETLFNTY